MAIGHGLLREQWPVVIGCILRTASGFLILEAMQVYKGVGGLYGIPFSTWGSILNILKTS